MTSSPGDAPVLFSLSTMAKEVEEACPGLDWAWDAVKRRGVGKGWELGFVARKLTIGVLGGSFYRSVAHGGAGYPPPN
jgi:hypothetical protein